MPELRCDLCDNVENVNYTWFTPNPNPHLSAKEAEAQRAPWCEDPEWAVCDVCHLLILADKPLALLIRSLEAQKKLIWMEAKNGVFDLVAEAKVAEHIKTVHDFFWTYKTTYLAEV